MNGDPEVTEFLVEEVGILHHGKVALVGMVRGQPVKPGMRAIVSIGSERLTVEVVSIGIVDPTPENPDKKLLQVGVSGGDARTLRSETLHLK